MRRADALFAIGLAALLALALWAMDVALPDALDVHGIPVRP